MHSVFFVAKRAHLSTVKFCREALVKWELTPARYDLLLFLKHRGTLTQRQLRKAFGVSRATMSEAICSLVARGLVVREGARDRRTFNVCLTEHGRSIFVRAWKKTKWVVNRAVAKIFGSSDRIMRMHIDIDRYGIVRKVFGDTAVRELKWLWHPNN